MKRHIHRSPSLSALVLASCGTGERVIQAGGFDPLDARRWHRPQVRRRRAGHRPGALRRDARMDNAAFFKQAPTGDGDPDKLSAGNTPMKVVSDGRQLREGANWTAVRWASCLRCMVIDPNAARSGGLSRMRSRWIRMPSARWPPVGCSDPGAPIHPAGDRSETPAEIDPDAPEPIARRCRRCRIDAEPGWVRRAIAPALPPVPSGEP